MNIKKNAMKYVALCCLVFTLCGCSLISAGLKNIFSKPPQIDLGVMDSGAIKTIVDPSTLAVKQIYLSPEKFDVHRGLGTNTISMDKIRVMNGVPEIVEQRGHRYFKLEDKKYFQIDNLSDDELNVNGDFTLIVSVLPNQDLLRSDFWSWGDCGDDRFMIHIPESGDNVHAMLGDPGKNALDVKVKSDPGVPLIVYLIHKPENTVLGVNRAIVKMAGKWNRVKPKTMPLQIGYGSCGHYFNGLVGDVWYTNQALEESSFRSVLNFFEDKYHR